MSAVLLQSVKTREGDSSTTEFVISDGYNPTWTGDANNLYAQYVANYVGNTKTTTSRDPSISVEVDQFVNPDDAQNYLSSIQRAFPLRKEENPDLKMEIALTEGGKIETYDGPSFSGAIWRTVNDLIDITFYKPDYYMGLASSTDGPAALYEAGSAALPPESDREAHLLPESSRSLAH